MKLVILIVFIVFLILWVCIMFVFFSIVMVVVDRLFVSFFEGFCFFVIVLMKDFFEIFIRIGFLRDLSRLRLVMIFEF